MLVVLGFIIEYWEIALAIAGVVAILFVLAHYGGDQEKPANFGAAGGWSVAIIAAVVATVVLGNAGEDEKSRSGDRAKSADAGARDTADGGGGGGGGGGNRGSAAVTGSTQSGEDTGDFPTDRVTRVIDGDTVETENLERVRLIGVDTPEEGACHDNAATRFTRRRLEGQVVGYELDQERKDRYGRTLAYLYRDGMHNLALLKAGHAKVLTIPPNDKYADQFEQAERKAKRYLEGLWLSCDKPSPGGGGGGGGGEQEESGGSAPAAPSGDIDCSDVSGPIPTPPGDPNGLDGDGDGMACE